MRRWLIIIVISAVCVLPTAQVDAQEQEIEQLVLNIEKAPAIQADPDRHERRLCHFEPGL